MEASFARVGVTVEWQGSGVKEVGVDAKGVLGETGRVLVQVDNSRVPQRHGADARNATSMADQKREKYLQDGGYEVKNYFG